MALIWAPSAAAGRRRCPLPCWASPLPPGHGGWHDRPPSGGPHACSRLAISEGKGRLESWMLCDRLGEGVMG